jgi:integrase
MRAQPTDVKTKSRPNRPAKCLFFLRGHSIPRDLSGCPFLCDSGVDYDLANDFLEDIHRRRWYPHLNRLSLAGAFVSRRLRRNSPASDKQRAHKISNFVRWAATENLHDGAKLAISEIGEAHLDQFADDMESGEWSDDGEPRSAGYIGIQQIAAIDFIDWAAHKNYRKPLELACTVPDAPRARNGVYTTIFRIVRRAAPGILDFPPADADIRVLKNIPDRADKLCGATVFRSGLRASEACAIGANDLPLGRPEAKLPMFTVLGKGNQPRPVVLDPALIPEIRKYYDFERSVRLAKCRKTFGSNSSEYQLASSRLFLNSRDGRALSYRSFWCAFKHGANLAGLPYLSPHWGRHWYAGSQLANAHRRVGQTANLSNDLAPAIQFLRKQLGHRSIETTEIYLNSYLRQVHAEDHALPRQDAFLEALQ